MHGLNTVYEYNPFMAKYMYSAMPCVSCRADYCSNVMTVAVINDLLFRCR